ncbi:ATP-dependent helicase [Clostridium sp. ZS2-4]|uniref:ATP-dependent helicase n=1 Tax=Clostridium sp. ZS2-4 TaxID=2987703 RepID=UPI00227C09AC|nr:ATP-dependent helicase [Clostridium sp. ZS2-4]MCY6353634.1 ATP-dependent helicase [Clostridium sp. ZS2-4]
MEKMQQIKKDEIQFEAYNTQESTVVIAGPGSGKTTVLTLKIIKLLREMIKEPRGLACVTFSREAAREFKQRLNKLGYEERQNVFLGTVHSFCISEVLGNFAHLYDYNIPMPIKIISDKNKNKLFKKVVEDLGIDNTGIKLSEMDKERTLNIKGISSVKIPTYDVALKAAHEYEKRLHKSGFMDYESIIKFSTLLIQEQEYVRKCLSAKFPWIVVDEYQDLGRPLHEMILSLFTKTEIKIFAVGDPDQSIYGFSGAIPDYLHELYKRNDIIAIELKNNYRSNQDIVDGSELVLNSKRNYVAATRKEEKAEFVFITCEEDLEDQYNCCVNEIIPYYIDKGISLEEIVILAKINENVKDLAKKFSEKNIPHYISKHDFERSDFVKWLETCGSWVNDKISVSFDEIYLYWERLILLHNDKEFFNGNRRILEKRKLYDVLANSYESRSKLKLWIQNIIENLNIFNILNGSSVYPDEIDNLEKLLNVASQNRYKNYDISKFSKLGKPENQVTLTTRHSSKGLEFEVVVILGMEEGNFPDYRSVSDSRKVAEENRMCFVCISRAKKACVLVRSKYYNIKKRNGENWHKFCEESRYWKILHKKHAGSNDLK